MADYVDREKEIKSWEKAIEIAPDERYPVDEIIRSLKNAPSVDVVEVVRCKDCKYRTIKQNMTLCAKLIKPLKNTDYENLYIQVNDNDYCKWGEKE